MRLSQLIAEWRARLRRVRALAEDPSNGWLCEIRARILNFLISRYEMKSDAGRSIPARDAVWTRPPPIPMFMVVAADGRPPRSSAAIAAILEDIRRCNRRQRYAWWFRPRRTRP
jgi:hypothetical protein